MFKKAPDAQNRKRDETFMCRPLIIERHGVEKVRGQTCSGEKSFADLSIYRVTLPNEDYLDVAYAIWKNGERDIHTYRVESSIRALRRLDHGLRLSIDRYSSRISAVELRQARLVENTPKQWSRCFKASLKELREGAGLNCVKVLRRAGAEAIGTKQDVFEDNGKRRDFLCATFKSEAQWPPILAYVVSRILPLMRGYRHKDYG